MNGPCDLFKEEYYEKAKRRESDQLFCNVIFEEGGKSYCYFLNDEDLMEGDYVVVPVGSKNRTSIAQIESIQYYAEDSVLFPVDKIKRIIRKCTEEDLK